jgi:methylmalonyl-CoA carboxyltransferase small subunit
LKLKVGIDGNEYVVDIEVLEDDSAGPAYLAPHGQPTTVQPISLPTPGTEASPADENVEESKVCRSPVAGVVVKLNVQPGQTLQTNDLMVVLEAMKMETNITAPVAGKIKKINVAPGDGVKVNQIVVEFE